MAENFEEILKKQKTKDENLKNLKGFQNERLKKSKELNNFESVINLYEKNNGTIKEEMSSNSQRKIESNKIKNHKNVNNEKINEPKVNNFIEDDKPKTSNLNK